MLVEDGHGDFQAEEVDGGDDQRLDGREPGEQRPHPGQQAADADAEEGGEEDEVGEIGQEPHVGGHPANQRNFEEEDDEGDEEEAKRPHWRAVFYQR